MLSSPLEPTRVSNPALYQLVTPVDVQGTSAISFRVISSSTATINGVLGLAPGLPPSGDAVINVGAGSTASGVDLLVNAVAIGGAPYLDKQGAGTMSLTAANTFTGVTLLEAGIIAMGNGGALSGQGVVIYGGATLRMDVNGTMNQGMELYGTGVGGVDGAVQVSPGVNFSINGDCLLDAARSEEH